MPFSTCFAYPENSCASVSGTASIRCVRPIFTTPLNSRTFASSASCRCRSAGTRWCTTSSAVEIDIAAGKTSLEDCDMLTWSLGWTGSLDPISPPISSIARFEITSLAFMFDCVPEPVCHTTSGKWSSKSPSITCCAARRMASARSASSLSSCSLVVAEVCLMMPSARRMGRGIRSMPILKFCSERCVCAPQ